MYFEKYSYLFIGGIEYILGMSFFVQLTSKEDVNLSYTYLVCVTKLGLTSIFANK